MNVPRLHAAGPGLPLWVLGCVCLGLALGGSLAHLYELPHKMALPMEEYLVVQQIYRGWSLLAGPILGVLLASFILALQLRTQPRAFPWAISTFALIAATQVIFWVWTYPVNAETRNWTMLPPNWEVLRARWEYSHAAGAVLNIAALVTFVLAALHARR